MTQAMRKTIGMAERPWDFEFHAIDIDGPMRGLLDAFTRNTQAAAQIPGSHLRQMSFKIGEKTYYALLGSKQGYEAAMSCVILTNQYTYKWTDQPVGQRVNRWYIERLNLYVGTDHSGNINEAWLEAEWKNEEYRARLLLSINDADHKATIRCSEGCK